MEIKLDVGEIENNRRRRKIDSVNRGHGLVTVCLLREAYAIHAKYNTSTR